MPHLGHVISLVIVEVMDGVLTDVVIGILAMSSRSGIGLRMVGTDVHTVREIDPGDEPVNMRCLLALE